MNIIADAKDIWLIGGGGKTTLMFLWAAACAERGERVICTTSTRIWIPTSEQCTDVRVGNVGSLLKQLRSNPVPFVTLAQCVEGGKCLGFAADEVELMKPCTDRLIVEADGSAQRPVKAHASHEPVLSPLASCVVAVVGGWCVGTPLDGEHVHRPEIFSALSHRPLGDAVTAEDVAGVILSQEGWLRRVPSGAAFHVVVTGRENGLLRALEAHPNSGRLTAVHSVSVGAGV